MRRLVQGPTDAVILIDPRLKQRHRPRQDERRPERPLGNPAIGMWLQATIIAQQGSFARIKSPLFILADRCDGT